MSDEKRTLTTRQGHPVHSNHSSRSVSNRGPITLENYHLIEKISHFDRERIPERVVHARGFVAHGEFEAYGTIGDEPASKYTRAKLFQTKGKKTPVTLRFSTVIGGRDSSEAARDPRGFAVKLKTEDGNWDIVGNNLPVFFIRDAIKFPDVIHALKPDPVTFRQEPNRIFDFMSMTPESLHMLTWLFSPRGIPKDYRHQDGFGVNTYRFVNAAGEGVLIKIHWKTQQGIESLTAAQAAEIQAKDLGHASKDLFQAIQRGDFPKWELNIQIMSDDEHPELDFDPLDDTKTWPEDQFPLRPAGVLTLNRNVENVFAENEQSAFGTGVLVDGIDFSDDKMLVGRTFSYSDTQRYRVGSNYLQLPVNAPLTPPNTNLADGQMTYRVDNRGTNPHVNYEPSSIAGLAEAGAEYQEYRPFVEGQVLKQRIDRENNYGQAGDRIRTMPDWEREDLLFNLVDQLGQAESHVAERMVAHFTKADEKFGQELATGLGIDHGSLDIDTLVHVR
ncbi:MAG: catalase [Actinomycetia bacterium]|jgi:catalase|nr:catalase [Actinomycetes bacterium]